MSLTSNLFFIFTLAALCIYYIVPKRFQWGVLLLSSYIYYMLVSVPAVIFLLFSTLLTYGCALWISKIYQDIQDKVSSGKKAKRIVTAGILLNIGMLGFLKYTNFFIDNINAVTRGELSHLNLILPLGISYYTFQTVGYLLDVYWKREQAERNICKYALFVSFFPQLVQGPIGRFGKLSKQLCAEHELDLKQIKYGVERIVWGLFKKMVIAEWAGVFRNAIFQSPEEYSGIAIFGVLLYTIELYGDFAGGIDIVIGISNLFGIVLDENFRQPLFAVSVSDLWRRWHMTLGSWMKDYVFYPLSLSKFMRNIQKVTKAKLGRKKGRFVTTAISNLIVFLIVGLWHGPSWNNIGWGFYNGVLIAASGFLEDAYKVWKKKLHIHDQNKVYYVFTVCRTFALFTLGLYFDCVSSFRQAFQMIRYSLSSFHPAQFLQISSGKMGTEYTPYALLTLAVGCILWLAVSVTKERGRDTKELLEKIPGILEFVIFLVLFISAAIFSPMAVARGFIYAQF